MICFVPSPFQACSPIVLRPNRSKQKTFYVFYVCFVHAYIRPEFCLDCLISSRSPVLPTRPHRCGTHGTRGTKPIVYNLQLFHVIERQRTDLERVGSRAIGVGKKR